MQAVGTHIGNQADRFAVKINPLIKLLGDLHGSPGAEAKLTRGFLLQSTGGKRRRGPALTRASLDRIHSKDAVQQAQVRQDGRGAVKRGDLAAVGLVDDIDVIDFDQLRREFAFAPVQILPGQPAVNRPVFDWNKSLDFFLALDDQAQGDALHPSGRQAPPRLVSQKAGHFIADQPVDDAPRLLGIDQIHVDASRL